MCFLSVQSLILKELFRVLVFIVSLRALFVGVRFTSIDTVHRVLNVTVLSSWTTAATTMTAVVKITSSGSEPRHNRIHVWARMEILFGKYRRVGTSSAKNRQTTGGKRVTRTQITPGAAVGRAFRKSAAATTTTTSDCICITLLFRYGRTCYTAAADGVENKKKTKILVKRVDSIRLNHACSRFLRNGSDFVYYFHAAVMLLSLFMGGGGWFTTVAVSDTAARERWQESYRALFLLSLFASV